MQFALTPFQYSSKSSPGCCDDSTFCADDYEFYKIVALMNNTTVTAIGATNRTYTLNASQFTYLFGMHDEYINLVSNKPISVAHIMAGTDYKGKT